MNLRKYLDLHALWASHGKDLYRILNKAHFEKVRSLAKTYPVFLTFILFPLCLSGFYYSLIASKRYVSEAKFDIRHSGPQQSTGVDLGSLLSPSSANKDDDLVVKEFILSRDMLNILNEQLNLKKMYADRSIDFVSRLSRKATEEAFLAYYRSMIDVRYDDLSSIITVELQAYSPTFAQKMLSLILQESEKFVNRLSHCLAHEQMQFIDEETKKTHDKYLASKARLMGYQDAQQQGNPIASYQSAIGRVAALEEKLTQTEAEQKELLTYLNPKSPQVIACTNCINGLKEQIKEENKRLTGEDASSLNKSASNYETLKLETDFTQEAYKVSLNALEKSRIEAARKLKSLVLITKPSLPEEAKYPRTFYNLLTLLLSLMISYGIGFIMIAIVKDHIE